MVKQLRTARELTSFANLTDNEANEICRVIRQQFEGYTLLAMVHFNSGMHTFYVSRYENGEQVKPTLSQANRVRVAIEWTVRGFRLGKRLAVSACQYARLEKLRDIAANGDISEEAADELDKLESRDW